jgi:hypothetical protein
MASQSVILVERVHSCFADHNRVLDKMLDKLGEELMGDGFNTCAGQLHDFRKNKLEADGEHLGEMGPRAVFLSCIANWTLRQDRKRRKCINYALPPVEAE